MGGFARGQANFRKGSSIVGTKRFKFDGVIILDNEINEAKDVVAALGQDHRCVQFCNLTSLLISSIGC